MKCPRCQTHNTDTARFCGNCAAPLHPPEPAAVSQTETLETPVKELTTGTTFASRYQVIEELGRGGMGRVYKVFDTDIKEKIALKLLRPEIALDKEGVERFSNELKLARKIGHRNVCRMFDLGRAEGTTFITMEFVPGETLKSMIHMSGSLSLGMLLSVGKQICDGLAEAHRLGVVHRDLKPQNIMIDKDGQAKIMDFGIARSIGEKGITGPSVMVGTPEYLSPEQAEAKEVDHRADIYSLGIILYEMATGRVPFGGDTALSIAMKHKGEVPQDPKELNPTLPEDLARVILRCLEKDRADRFQSAAELQAELEKIGQGTPAVQRSVHKTGPLTSREITVTFRLRKLLWPAVAGVAAALIGLGAWRIFHRHTTIAAPKIENSIAVISFQNQTGDAAYDTLQEAVPNLLITGLEKSGGVYVVTWERLEDLLKQLGRPDVKTIDKNLGFQLCRMEGVESIVLGSIVKAENTFVTNVRVLDVESKRSLLSATARGEGEASILKTQIDELCRAIAEGMGLAKQKMDLETLRVAGVTTNSLEAYQHYLQGLEEVRKLYLSEAAGDFEKAVAIDPEFAMAHWYLSFAYQNLGKLNDAKEAIKRAKQNAAKATEKERLYIEAVYAWLVEMNPQKYLDVLQDLTQKYPKEKFCLLMLAQADRGMGNPQKSLEVAQKALSLDPEYGDAHCLIGYIYLDLKDYGQAVSHLEKYVALNPRDANPQDSLGDAYFSMGRVDDALSSFTKAVAIKPDFFVTYPKLAYIYALKEDYPRTQELIDRRLAADTAPRSQVVCYRWKALYSFWLGSTDRCLSQLQKVVETIAALGGDQDAPMINENQLRAAFFYHMDKLELSRQANEAWFSAASPVAQRFEKQVQIAHGFVAGLIDLKQKNIESARRRLSAMRTLIHDLPPTTDNETSQFKADYLEAEILFQEKRYDEAVTLFDKMPHLDVINVSNAIQVCLRNLTADDDLKARALDAKGDLGLAIAEYERLTTFDPKSARRRLINPLHYYRLAKLYEQKGLKVKAAEKYQRFLDLWKDADPGRPEVEDARERLTGVKGG